MVNGPQWGLRMVADWSPSRLVHNFAHRDGWVWSGLGWLRGMPRGALRGVFRGASTKWLPGKTTKGVNKMAA